MPKHLLHGYNTGVKRKGRDRKRRGEGFRKIGNRRLETEDSEN